MIVCFISIKYYKQNILLTFVQWNIQNSLQHYNQIISKTINQFTKLTKIVCLINVILSNKPIYQINQFTKLNNKPIYRITSYQSPPQYKVCK